MKRSHYSLHPGFAREAAYRENLAERTGKTLEQWVAVARKRGLPTVKERVAWLTATHDLTTDYARWIAEECDGATGADAYDPDVLITAMFAKKRALVPLYEALLDLGLALGADVKACPCSTMVSIFRKHVIAQLKPTTLTRIDLGLALGDPKKTPAKGRLVDTGGFAKKDRISHRIAIEKPADIDATVKRWLEVAYERDALRVSASAGPTSSRSRRATRIASPAS
jgi:hypothetical protein